MGQRIDHVKIVLDVMTEFEGHNDVEISFMPTDADDPLMRLILEKWRAQDAERLAELRKTGVTEFPFFG